MSPLLLRKRASPVVVIEPVLGKQEITLADQYIRLCSISGCVGVTKFALTLIRVLEAELVIPGIAEWIGNYRAEHMSELRRHRVGREAVVRRWKQSAAGPNELRRLKCGTSFWIAYKTVPDGS